MATSTHGARNSTFKYNETTVDPTVDNDTDEGYSVGSRWWNTTTDKEFVCLDITDGAAVWVPINPDANYAGISVNNNTTTTTIGGATTWVQVVVFDTDDAASGSTPDHTNDHITISETGDYLVTVSLSFESPDASAQTFQYQVQKNNGGTQLTSLTLERKLGTGGDVGSASISGIVNLSATDTIELWVQNLDGTNNATMTNGNLAVQKIPGIGGSPSRSSDKSFFVETVIATDDIPIHRFDVAVTLSKIVYAIGGTTNWVGQLQEATDAQGTGATDTAAADSTVTTTTTVTSFTNAAFASGSYVFLKSTSISGTPDWLHISFYYDED